MAGAFNGPSHASALEKAAPEWPVGRVWFCFLDEDVDDANLPFDAPPPRLRRVTEGPLPRRV
ncbi:hypothetical protein C2U72_14735 [Prosthecomicrobium hirschii]|uniref:hypothetical protein n=1 Tax=Prosthecodimorpha hirschii TaxID=665126 RepID=UPI00112E49B7|nr:hypothetical protein [Prosthecomicrobium hirschii]TPQ50183.1 hypothetical protein C2U72_14735 [Prosthecomicrobium hirschii]